MSGLPGYSAWHPRRLPERSDSVDSLKGRSSRPPTPLFGPHIQHEPGPRGPQLTRQDSNSSLLAFELQPTAQPPRPTRGLHQRAHSMMGRVPLPQGISVFVGLCTTLAFVLSVTTLIIGVHNRQMLLEATEARHDPHGALASLIYTAVLEALKSNQTAIAPGAPPPLAGITRPPH